MEFYLDNYLAVIEGFMCTINILETDTINVKPTLVVLITRHEACLVISERLKVVL